MDHSGFWDPWYCYLKASAQYSPNGLGMSPSLVHCYYDQWLKVLAQKTGREVHRPLVPLTMDSLDSKMHTHQILTVLPGSSIA